MTGLTVQTDLPPEARTDEQQAALRRVSFTGRLGTITRADATALIEAAGGRVVADVSRRTTLLVVGTGGWPFLRDGSVSRKLLRAEALVEAGEPLRIISETELLERLGRAAEGEDDRAAGGYPRSAACRMLGVSETMVQRWEALGLIRTRDDQLDFRDLVSLQTIARLIADGVDPATIGASVRRLARVLPVERPLAQLSLVADNGELRAEVAGAMVAPDGQLHFDFSAAVEHHHGSVTDDDVAAPLATAQPTSADGWFDRGILCEDAGDLEGARDAYRRALARGGRYPDAHFNLGNVLRALGSVEAAEAHFLMAATQDPERADAWYNLADVQEELGRFSEAIESLRSAIAAAPTYADAHWNLAACCEEAGRGDEAREHWRAYLLLDGRSEWAAEARRRLTKQT